MVYTPNIPNASDFIDESQPIIKANFQQLDTSFGLNHYSFSDGTANNGKHKYAVFPEQTVDGPTAVNEVSVYSKEYNTVASLFLRLENSGIAYPWTGNVKQTATAGETWILGFQVKFFQIATVTSVLTTYNYTSFGLTNFNSTCIGIVGNNNSNLQSTYTIVPVANTGLSVNGNSTNSTGFFIAIGY